MAWWAPGSQASLTHNNLCLHHWPALICTTNFTKLRFTIQGSLDILEEKEAQGLTASGEFFLFVFWMQPYWSAEKLGNYSANLCHAAV